VLSGQPGCPAGRTSIVPILAKGERSARAIASLEVAHVDQREAVELSLVSAKGPSVAGARREHVS